MWKHFGKQFLGEIYMVNINVIGTATDYYQTREWHGTNEMDGGVPSRNSLFH